MFPSSASGRAPRAHSLGRRVSPLCALALAAALAIPLVSNPSAATARAGPARAAAAPVTAGGLFDESPVPQATLDSDTTSVELGMRFSPSVAGTARGAQIYKLATSASRTPSSATLWNGRGEALARVSIPTTTQTGWIQANFSTPVSLTPGKYYTISYYAPRGRYAATQQFFRTPISRNGLTAPSGAGVYTYAGNTAFPTNTYLSSNYWVDVVFRASSTSAATPTPAPTPTSDPTPPSEGAYPNLGNTGVPEGVTLTSYEGPMTINQADTVIDAKEIEGRLVIKAPRVVVTRSRVKGSVYVQRSGSLTMSDSTVRGGTSQDSAVSQSGFTLRRVEVVGARASVGCDNDCKVIDSWLHGQYMRPGSDWHGDGFLSNGGSNMVLRHNTLACDSKPTGNGGACSAALALYGDFAPIKDVTVENNQFVSSPAGYCMYGGYDPNKPYGKRAENITVRGNVFARGSSGKCGVYGAVTAVATGGTNVFSGNTWDDGKALRAP